MPPQRKPRTPTKKKEPGTSLVLPLKTWLDKEFDRITKTLNDDFDAIRVEIEKNFEKANKSVNFIKLRQETDKEFDRIEQEGEQELERLEQELITERGEDDPIISALVRLGDEFDAVAHLTDELWRESYHAHVAASNAQARLAAVYQWMPPKNLSETA